MNAPINERLAYPPVAKANGRVELITAQAREVLNLRRLPAMLTAAQTAALLDGGGEHNIPVLVRKGLLEPLGNPPANAVKYFATVEVLELAANIKRLGRIEMLSMSTGRARMPRKPNPVIASPATVRRATDAGLDGGGLPFESAAETGVGPAPPGRSPSALCLVHFAHVI